MRHVTLAIAVSMLLVAAPVHADRGGRGGGYGRGGGWHGGGHFHGGGWHGGGWNGPRIFIGSGIYWDPFWPSYYPYYYPYPAPYPYPYYPPPPPDDPNYGRDDNYAPPPRDDRDAGSAPADEAPSASYALIQLRGVPDGAEVQLDGRPWLRASSLDNKWMAVAEGEHTITVRVNDGETQTRDVEVRPGAKQIIKFGPFRRG